MRTVEATAEFREMARGRTDWVQPACILALAVAGVFFIHSAQCYSGSRLWVKQAVWLGLGAGVYTALSRLDYRIFMRCAHWIYWGSVALLAQLALSAPPFRLPLLGVERFHAWRWLDFKFFAFQPAETAKIGVLIMASSVLARSEVGSVGESLRVLVKLFFVILVPFLLIFSQPDLGSVLIFPPMVFSLLYVSKLSGRFFLVACGVFLLMAGVLWLDLGRYQEFLRENQIKAEECRGEYQKQSVIPLKDYQRNRILAFLAPEAVDPKGIGVSWNLRQSLHAVGSGGWTGQGWREGTQAKLGYLPRSVAHNDFIFSVLAEEKGFMGSLLVLGLYFLLVANGLRIAGEARDRFGRLLAAGVSAVFLVHVFINTGMTIGLTPITGLPLPFLSYGGSFVLSCCICQGLLQSVYRHRRDFT